MNDSGNIKQNIHILIDKIENEELLDLVYQLLNSTEAASSGEMIDSLSVNEKQDLYKSYEESFDEANLIDLDHLKPKHLRWFGK